MIADGLTHASSVSVDESCKELEFGTLTRAFVPLNESAPSNLPRPDHVVFATVPVLPLPEASETVVPAPSLKA